MRVDPSLASKENDPCLSPVQHPREQSAQLHAGQPCPDGLEILLITFRGGHLLTKPNYLFPGVMCLLLGGDRVSFHLRKPAAQFLNLAP